MTRQLLVFMLRDRPFDWSVRASGLRIVCLCLYSYLVASFLFFNARFSRRYGGDIDRIDA